MDALHESQCQFTKLLVTHIAITKSKIQLSHCATKKNSWSLRKRNMRSKEQSARKEKNILWIKK